MIYGVSDLRYTDWDKEIMHSEKPVVVEFWHKECPICMKLEPTFLSLPLKMAGKAKFMRLNVMENRESRRFAIEKGVIGTPTIKIYCRGVDIGELVGLETLEANLEETIDSVIKRCQNN